MASHSNLEVSAIRLLSKLNIIKPNMSVVAKDISKENDILIEGATSPSKRKSVKV